MEKPPGAELVTGELSRAIIDNTISGVALLSPIEDSKGEIIDFIHQYANQPWHNMLGAKQLSEKKLLPLFPEQKVNGLFQLYKEVCNRQKTDTLEVFYQGKLDSWVLAEAVPVPQGVAVLLRDIQKTKLAQIAAAEVQKQQARNLKEKISQQNESLAEAYQELDNYNHQLEEAQRIAKVGSWVWDLRTNEVTWSDQLYRILGVENKGQALTADDFYKYIHPDDIDRIQETAQKIVKGKRFIPTEHRIVTTKGVTKYVYGIGGYEIKNEQGEVVKFFGIVKDITESKENEIELQAALEKERELSNLKSRFVSMASHEFRTPLATILSSVSLIDRYEGVEFAAKRKKHIQRIKSNVQNMRSILDDFLSLSKLEEQKLEIQEEPLDLEDFYEELIEGLRNQVKPGQSLVYQHRGPKKEVLLDPHLLRNISLNLLSNAIKYSKEGKAIQLHSEVGEQEVKIKVIDQGIGIPEQEKKFMFTRFFRAKNATNIQGTGLGLTIVQRYIDLMKGSISFESELGVGSTFTVRLPQNGKCQ
jgi:PAS domain S-box-containing protein